MISSRFLFYNDCSENLEKDRTSMIWFDHGNLLCQILEFSRINVFTNKQINI